MIRYNLFQRDFGRNRVTKQSLKITIFNWLNISPQRGDGEYTSNLRSDFIFSLNHKGCNQYGDDII